MSINKEIKTKATPIPAWPGFKAEAHHRRRNSMSHGMSGTRDATGKQVRCYGHPPYPSFSPTEVGLDM